MEQHKMILTTDDLILGTNLPKEEFKYLDELFDIDDEFEELSLFEGDPDYIKVFGEDGLGEIPFITASVNGTTIYIISSYYMEHYECYDKAFEILEWYIGGAKNSKEIDNNWNAWNTVKEGIAYRGGSGYFYSLYAKELM